MAGLLPLASFRAARAQEGTKQNRIAIIAAGPVARIHDPGVAFFRAVFEELRRLGDVEGQNLTVDAYSGGGRPEAYADLAREVVNSKPDVIVASTNPIALAVRAATTTIPIVWIGVEAIGVGLVTNLARPGGNITGVSLVDAEFYAKRLEILKEAIPSASKVGWLTPRKTWEGAYGQAFQRAFREAYQRLGISVVPMLLRESTPTEYQRAFAEITQDQPDAILVSDIGDLTNYHKLIVELVEKSHLPAMYGAPEFMEVGGLMAYEADFGEAGRRVADDVHQILNGTRPGDIPIYQSTKFALVINLKAAKALGLTLPPTLLARADELIE